MTKQCLIEFVESKDILVSAGRIVEAARAYAGRQINLALVAQNWLLGRLIAEQEMKGRGRADYGEEIVARISARLTAKFGRGFESRKLYRCVKFYRAFPDILTTVRSKSGAGTNILTTAWSKSAPMISWSHYRRISDEPDRKARDWYAKEASDQNWSVRTLDRNIATQYYHRMLSSQNGIAEVNCADRKNVTATTIDFIKNPVVAEFLGLPSNPSYSEGDLESAIITHLQQFLLEMGKGFAFVARQQHIVTDAGEFFIDLVFYNIYLKCYLLIDLKKGQITHQDVGQMDMYIRMFDDLKRTEGDNPTVGLVLCSETSQDIAKYSVLNGSQQLFAAKYLTYLPTKAQLKREIELQREVFLLQQKRTPVEIEMKDRE